MKINIDLDESILEQYEQRAKQNGRSRKKEIEMTLVSDIQ